MKGKKKMKQAFLVRVMWRKPGTRKDRKIWATDITEARNVAFRKFGVNRGVRAIKENK